MNWQNPHICLLESLQPLNHSARCKLYSKNIDNIKQNGTVRKINVKCMCLDRLLTPKNLIFGPTNVKLYCLGLNSLTDTLTSAWDAMRVNFGVPAAASKPSQWGLHR